MGRWLWVLGVAGCVGPYPSTTPREAPHDACTAPTTEYDLLRAFRAQYCDQLDQCTPGAACSPPDLAPETGPCAVDDQAAHDCLCGDWSCDAYGVVYPDACDLICG